MCQLASVVLSFASGLWENTLLAGHSGAGAVLKASALLHVQQHNESSSHVNRAVIKSALHCWGMMRTNGDVGLLLHSSERACHLYSVWEKKKGFVNKFHTRLLCGSVWKWYNRSVISPSWNKPEKPNFLWHSCCVSMVEVGWQIGTPISIFKINKIISWLFTTWMEYSNDN